MRISLSLSLSLCLCLSCNVNFRERGIIEHEKNPAFSRVTFLDPARVERSRVNAIITLIEEQKDKRRALKHGDTAASEPLRKCHSLVAHRVNVNDGFFSHGSILPQLFNAKRPASSAVLSSRGEEKEEKEEERGREGNTGAIQHPIPG